MKLADYIEQKAVNKSKFAKKCGLNYYQIHHMLRGNVPTLATALKICKGTGGEVTPEDLLTEEVHNEVYGCADNQDQPE